MTFDHEAEQRPQAQHRYLGNLLASFSTQIILRYQTRMRYSYTCYPVLYYPSVIPGHGLGTNGY